MFERSEQILRIACVCLAAILIYQVASLLARKDPLENVKIPAVPTLASATNSAAAANKTNQTAVARGAATNTSVATDPAVAKQGSNTVSEKGRTTTDRTPTEVAQGPNTNSGIKTTNLAQSTSANTSTNGSTNAMAISAALTTNVAAQDPVKRSSNSSPDIVRGATGTVAAARSGQASRGTDSIANRGASRSVTTASSRGRGRGPELPPAIQAKVDRITQSELLAPVVRPQPMALLGIAGNTAFLRGPNGQTGLAKEGEEVGGIKLLRIGINRVLVEEEGQKKELMIFSGYGGESLMPKEKDHSQ